MAQGCHNCRKKRTLANCAQCRRIDFDDIEIRTSPHTVAELVAARTGGDAARPTRFTRLPAFAEDALRGLFAAAAALEPIDALLLLHVANGGTFAGFGRAVDALADRLGRFARSGGMSRQLAQIRWENLTRRFAPFAALRKRAQKHKGGTNEKA